MSVHCDDSADELPFPPWPGKAAPGPFELAECKRLAAEEMFEALVAVERHLLDNARMDTADDLLKSMTALHTVRAAIAKAKGERYGHLP